MATILVVEDEPAIAAVLWDVLEDEGYQVIMVSNGHAGLASLAEVRPALVLSDLMMPGLDGRGLCRAMQADARFRTIPMVLMTGGAPPDAEEGYAYAAFLRKPFDLDRLVSTISRVLGEPAAG